MPENKYFFQKGQIALLMVLAMVVVGTVALSLASRSLVDVKVTDQEKEKIRAFSAAEAGIEDLLSQGLETAGSSGTNISLGTGEDQINYDYQVSEEGEGNFYELESPLLIGETLEINLEGSSDIPDSFNFCWDSNASLEASFVYECSSSFYTVRRWPVTASGNPLGVDEDFYVSSQPSGGSCGGSSSYNSRYTISTVDDEAAGCYVRKIRIKALHDQPLVGIWVTGGSLPFQAYKAFVSSGRGESNAAVEVEQGIGTQASIFDYALWSRGVEGITTD